jgi:hypothetical protein
MALSTLTTKVDSSSHHITSFIAFQLFETTKCIHKYILKVHYDTSCSCYCYIKYYSFVMQPALFINSLLASMYVYQLYDI